MSAWKTHAQRVATVGAVGVTAALVWFLRPPPPPRDPPAVRQVEVILKGEKPRYAYSGNTLAISRDGCRLVYSLNRQDAPLHLLFLDSGVNRELSGTEGGVDPFISPDGQHVGFTVGKQIKTASLESGGIRDCGVTNGEFGGRGASWGDGRIVYSPTHDGSLWTVRPEGGEPSRLTRLAAGEFSHRWPQCLPGGEHVLFMAGKPMASQGKKRETQSYNLEVIELATGVRTVIKERCAYGRYSRSGHIFFVSKGNLYVQAFDLGRLALEGERRLLREGVAVSSWEAAQFAASDDGTLVYSTGGDLSDEVGVRKLVWVGSDGGTEEASAQRGGFLQMDLSPDGGKVALAGEDWTILLLNLETDQIQRLTLGEGRHSHPVWDAVGESVLFVSDLGEEWGVWERKADFSAAAEPLFSQPGEPFAPRSLSADGGRLYGTGANAETGMDVWVFARAGASARPTFVVREPGFQGLPDLSPQGWLVFQSGSALNVVHVDRPGAVQPLPIPEGSKDPRWSPDGDRLYYDNGSAVWSVAVTPQGETLRFGTPARRFKLPSSTLLGQWEVDPGGERLLVLVIDDDPTSPRGGSNSVHIVFNWESELREPAPGGDEH